MTLGGGWTGGGGERRKSRSVHAGSIVPRGERGWGHPLTLHATTKPAKTLFPSGRTTHLLLSQILCLEGILFFSAANKTCPQTHTHKKVLSEPPAITYFPSCSVYLVPCVGARCLDTLQFRLVSLQFPRSVRPSPPSTRLLLVWQ